MYNCCEELVTMSGVLQPSAILAEQVDNVGDHAAAILMVQQVEARISDLLLQQLDELRPEALHHFGGLKVMGLQNDPAALQQEEEVTVVQLHLEVAAGEQDHGDQGQH